MSGEWWNTDPIPPITAHRIRPTVTRKFRIGGDNHAPTSIAEKRAQERLARILARLDAARAAS